ncbi:MAG: hypothetical protein ACOX4U_04055 [Anaerovoracaceae bacterium]|jgi:hypothetical protein
MDMGDMKSRDIGNMMAKGLVNLGRTYLENNQDSGEIPQGEIADEVKAQGAMKYKSQILPDVLNISDIPEQKTQR